MSLALVTGAAGFVGSRLLHALGARAVGFVRDGAPTPAGRAVRRGDLLEPGAVAAALEGVSTVVHLAARTGKATAQEHERVNLEGTRILLDAARAAGVERFVFVSSVAARFEDLRGYPYGGSKLAAEACVRASGLRWTIVRPTMVLGEGSPILDALRRLSRLPLLPVFGSGATAVQPVHVDDLVRMLVDVAADDGYDGAVWVAAGPETLPVGELLRRIRYVESGRRGPALHVPLTPLLPLLHLGERIAFDAMPFTVGQMATFRFDGSVRAGESVPRVAPRLDVAAMIGAADAALRREARTFGRLLAGQDPPPRAVEAYLAAHARRRDLVAANAYERALCEAASRGPATARMADGYARLFDPYGRLRRKLVLMLAILECLPPTHRALDAPLGGSPAAALPRLVFYGARAAVCAALGTARFAPLRGRARERG